MTKKLLFLKIYHPFFHVIVLIIALLLFFSSTGHTKAIVSAKYVSISKNQIEFIVKVDTPAPTNLIVQHNNPPQTLLISTTPKVSKVDNDKGMAKWFLKSIEPGEISFYLSFNKAVSEKGIQVTLIYRDPVSGKFTESVVLP